MARLERSCTGVDATDWIVLGPERETDKGVHRSEVRFAGHGYDPHRHDTYSLVITLSGVQSFDHRGARRDSTPGRAIVLHSDEIHDGRAGTDAGFHYRMLYVEPKLIRAALTTWAAALQFVRNSISDDPARLRSIAFSLEDLSHPLESLALDTLILDVSEAMLWLGPGAQHPRGRVAARFSERAVATARELLEAEAERSIDSPELERVTGLERHELCPQFRHGLGTNPYRYRTLRRLTRARKRIEAGEALIEVAASCGFANQSHMTRAFKRACGIAPGRWQRLLEVAAR